MRAAANLDSPALVSLVEQIVRQRVIIDPTTVVYQFPQRGFQPVTPERTRYLSDAARAYQERPRPPAGPEDDARAQCLDGALEKQRAFVKRVHDAGGIIVAGTDPVSPRLIPGYALHRELKNLVDAGLSPVAAIKAATGDAAAALGRAREFGIIAPGMLADLVVVSGAVEKDVTAIGSTVMVFKEGVKHDPGALRRSAEGRIQ